MTLSIFQRILEIDETLNPQTPVFRIVDFFAAATVIETNELRFTRSDSFEDRNEGVDRLLSQLELSRPSGCGGMGWNDEISAIREHDRVKRSHYVSCWTLVPESVAMWSLYSPEKTAVRLSTTVGKLQNALLTLVSQQRLATLTPADLNKAIQVFASAKLTGVRYANLSNIASRLYRRNKAFDRLRARYEQHGQQLPSPTEVDPRYWKREEQRQLRELTSAFALKDTSFEHEKEVRLVARMGELRVSQTMLDILALPDSEPMKTSVLRRYLQSVPPISESTVPSHLTVRVPDALIESVAIDPRCAPHRAAFIERWFQERGIPVCKSSCFGYLPSKFEVFPPE